MGVGTIHVPLAEMISAFGLDHMRDCMLALITERNLAYYCILTNCRDVKTGIFSKELLLYHPAPMKTKDDGFKELIALL